MTDNFEEDNVFEARDLSIKRMLDEARKREGTRSQIDTGLYLDSNVDSSSILYIPPHLIPEDEIWMWGRETCDEKEDSSRISSLIHHGWIPVPAQDHPSLVLGLKTRELGEDTFIRRGGLILLKMSKRDHDKLVNKMQRMTDLIEEGISENEQTGWSPVNERRQRAYNRERGLVDHGRPL